MAFSLGSYPRSKFCGSQIYSSSSFFIEKIIADRLIPEKKVNPLRNPLSVSLIHLLTNELTCKFPPSLKPGSIFLFYIGQNFSYITINMYFLISFATKNETIRRCVTSKFLEADTISTIVKKNTRNQKSISGIKKRGEELESIVGTVTAKLLAGRATILSIFV